MGVRSSAQDKAPSTDASDPRLDFDRQKWTEERTLRERELVLRERDRPSPWRSPLTIAVVAAAMAAAGNAIVSQVNGSAQARLERVKAEQSLIIEAIKTGGDVDKAAANLDFLVNTGLVTDPERAKRIKAYIDTNRRTPERLPSLPSVGQTQPPAARRPPVFRVAPAPSPTATVSPRNDPATSITNRVRSIVPGRACPANTTGAYCVAEDVLVGPGGTPFRVADATARGARMAPPQLIVMHYTGTGDGGAVRFLTSPDSSGRNASAHVVIERDGTITQLVPFDVASFHAGTGRWEGAPGVSVNRVSIGVEFSNWGQLRGVPGAWRTFADKPVPDEQVFTVVGEDGSVTGGWEKFTDAQLAAADRIVAALAKRYPTLRAIVGHSEVSPGRHQDPGPALPMERFRGLLAPSRR